MKTGRKERSDDRRWTVAGQDGVLSQILLLVVLKLWVGWNFAICLLFCAGVSLGLS
jgi:hypothetical protein